MRIKRSDHQRENALIIQLNSLNQFFKEMYIDQSGEITCEHWDFKVSITTWSQIRKIKTVAPNAGASLINYSCY